MRCFARMFLFAVLAVVLTASLQAQNNFGYTGSIQYWTVPTTSEYDISVWGAQGGPGTPDPGGLGAYVTGGYVLTAGTQLGIVVGGMGSTGSFGGLWGGGGGGGTYVFIVGGTSPLFVAGGGGGAGYCCGNPGGPGQITFNGQNGGGPGGGAGGVAGNGGAGGTGAGGNFNGGGGGGWLTDGTNGLGTGACTGFNGGSGNGGGGGLSSGFAAGLGGGTNPPCANGGFGGGGGGGWQGGGGGGGYSGGGGGDGITAPGGGGGSFWNSGTLISANSGVTSGNGAASINQVVPEPGTMIMFGTGVIGLAGLLRRKLNL